MLFKGFVVAVAACGLAAADPLQKDTVLKWTWGSTVQTVHYESTNVVAGSNPPAISELVFRLAVGSSLPRGVALDTADGSISGVPTTRCSVGACEQQFVAMIEAVDMLGSRTSVEHLSIGLSNIAIEDIEIGNEEEADEEEEEGMSSMVMVALVAVGGIVLMAAIFGAVFFKVRKGQAYPPQFHEMKAINIDTIGQLHHHQEEPAEPMALALASLPYAEPETAEALATLRRPVAAPRPGAAAQQPPLVTVAAALASPAPVVPVAASAEVSFLDASRVSDTSEPELPDEMQPWYAGSIRRTVCEHAVRSAEQGDFIVRQSRGSDTFVLVCHDSGAPSSFQITVLNADTRPEFEFARARFASITKIISFLRTNPMAGRKGQLLHLKSAITSSDLEQAEREVLILSTSISTVNSSVMSESQHSSTRKSQRVADELHPWYAGVMHRKKVEKYVSEAWHGAFLIRKSSKSNSFVLCVNDLGQATSFQITKNDAGKYYFGAEKGNSLSAIVEILRTAPISGRGGPITLGQPAPTKQGSK